MKTYLIPLLENARVTALVAVTLIALIVAGSMISLSPESGATDTGQTFSATSATGAEPEPPETPPLEADSPDWIHVEIKEGDNLTKVFRRVRLSSADLQAIIALGQDVAALGKIQPGQALSFQVEDNGTLMVVQYHKDALTTLRIARHEGSFVAAWETHAPETLLSANIGFITKNHASLYHAAKAAGISDRITMNLTDIFQWDISFAFDPRYGDSFSLLFEEFYKDDEKIGEGEIIAASFSNVGKEYYAVRYTDVNGRSDYFTPDGHSVRKRFARDPVHFSHVSSSFNLRRFHPIRKKVMPHRGIDYAARRGTPVVAPGDGTVTLRKQNKASGKYIVIQHGERFTTKYLHLSRFARAIKPGRAVTQGQTIGYVGSTGWATGPHLHYEFLVNGIHRNPKTVSLPKAHPIPEDELPRFRAATQPVLARLKALIATRNIDIASSPPTAVAPGG